MTPGESHNEWYQYYCSNICPFNSLSTDNPFKQHGSGQARYFQNVYHTGGISKRFSPEKVDFEKIRRRQNHEKNTQLTTRFKKPYIFVIFDQVMLKPSCQATEHRECTQGWYSDIYLGLVDFLGSKF